MLKAMNSKTRSLIFQKRALNYPYFILLFLCISSLSFLRFLSLGINPWYYTYSFAQGFFEIGIFILIAHFLKASALRWIYPVLLTFFFGCVLVHYTNFTMNRLLDVSLSYLLKFFVGQGIFHVISVFQAINMNQAMLALIGVAILSIPIIGISLYRLTNWCAKKKPFTISSFQILCALSFCGIFLLLFEWRVIPQFTHASHSKYEKTLPLGTTLFSPPLPHLILTYPVSPPPHQTAVLKSFENISLKSKPNIYLFVIETLRKDFINEQIAPYLTSFSKENIQFPFSFSNANSTQHSWVSIFYSLFPYHWTQLRKSYDQGSVPLQVLKKLGYKIHVYSAADLHYFDMDTMIFGPERILADQIVEYAQDRSIESWERDALVVQSFENEIQSNEAQEGNLFLFFLDATHSEYSFPEEFAHKFTPTIKQIDYLSLNTSDIEPIKNRYRNSIAYIDSLIQKFIAILKEKQIYEKAIIAITGDHGEEFFEEGSLFHGTHLNHVQTNVPIFFKFQNNGLPIFTNTVTHIDIFPSIIHFLTGKQISSKDFDGQSIFLKNRWPYRLAVLQNGAKTPSEFTIENEDCKIRARFIHPENLYQEKCLEILSLEMPQNKLSPMELDNNPLFEFLSKRLPEEISCEKPIQK